MFGVDSGARYTKDAFHRALVDGDRGAVNPRQRGTKAAAHYSLTVQPGETVTLRLRLNDMAPETHSMFGVSFEAVVEQRRHEADEFYGSVLPSTLSDDERRVARQALAGLLWSKQYYHYVVKDWLETAGPHARAVLRIAAQHAKGPSAEAIRGMVK